MSNVRSIFRRMSRPLSLVGATLACIVLSSAVCNAIALVLEATYGARATSDGKTVLKLFRAEPSSGAMVPLSHADFAEARNQLSGLAEVEAAQQRLVTLSLNDHRSLAEARWTTTEAHDRVRLPIAQGTCGENRAVPCFAISDSAWKEIGGPSDLSHIVATLDGTPIQVSAVMAPEFRGEQFDQRVDIWAIGSPLNQADSDQRTLDVSVRLRDGVGIRSLETKLSSLEGRPFVIRPDSYAGSLTSHGNAFALRPEIFALYLAVFGSILNLYALTEATLHRRRSDLALSTLLGASRRRLWLDHVRYGAFVGTLGGSAGCLLAYWLARVTVIMELPGLSLGALVPTAQQVVFTIVIATLVVVAAGWRVIRSLYRSGPSAGTAGIVLRSVTSGRRTAAAALQIGITCVMGLATLVAISSANAVADARRRFVAPGVSVLELRHPSGWQNQSAGQVAFRSLLLSVRKSLPHRTLALVAVLPFGKAPLARFVEGATDQASRRYFDAETNIATADYFSTVRVPIIDGRTFTSDDSALAPGVAVVNDVLANRYFDGRALGHTITTESGEVLRIVGVARMSNYPVSSKAEPMVFRPLAQQYSPKLYAVAREIAGSATEIATLRDDATKSRLLIGRSGGLEEFLADSLVLERLSSLVVGAASVVSAAIGLLGLYIILADTVVSRRREIGLKLALGAQRRCVFAELMFVAALALAGGLAIGLTVALFGFRIAGSLVYGISETSVTNSALLLLAIVAGGLVVAGIPAWRATQVDPAASLPAVFQFLGADPRPRPLTLEDRLVRWRERQGWSRVRTAGSLGIDEGTLAIWEAGLGAP